MKKGIIIGRCCLIFAGTAYRNFRLLSRFEYSLHLDTLEQVSPTCSPRKKVVTSPPVEGHESIRIQSEHITLLPPEN